MVQTGLTAIIGLESVLLTLKLNPVFFSSACRVSFINPVCVIRKAPALNDIFFVVLLDLPSVNLVVFLKEVRDSERVECTDLDSI